VFVGLGQTYCGLTGQNFEIKRKRAMAKEKKLNTSVFLEKKAKEPAKKHVKAVAGHELDNTPSSAMSGQSSGMSGKWASEMAGPDKEVDIKIGGENSLLGLSLLLKTCPGVNLVFWKMSRQQCQVRTISLLRIGKLRKLTNADRKLSLLPVRWRTRS